MGKYDAWSMEPNDKAYTDFMEKGIAAMYRISYYKPTTKEMNEMVLFPATVPDDKTGAAEDTRNEYRFVFRKELNLSARVFRAHSITFDELCDSYDLWTDADDLVSSVQRLCVAYLEVTYHG